MKTITRFPRACVSCVLVLASLSPAGCGPPDTVEIGVRRDERTGEDPARAGATSAQRFGVEELVEEEPAPSGPLAFDLPEGWTDLGPSGMRLVNLSAGEDTQCYVIQLAGEAGGLLENLNRWRSEVGLGPIRAEDVADLEQVELLGEPCPVLEVSGEYQGMGAESGAGRTLLATLRIRSEGSVFVKMVGPEAEVAAHRSGFLAFVRSLEE